MQVIEQNGKWLCEAEGKTYDSMTRRYIMNMQITDFTGQNHINVYNDHAQQLLGTTADEMAVLKEVSCLFLDLSICEQDALGSALLQTSPTCVCSICCPGANCKALATRLEHLRRCVYGNVCLALQHVLLGY